MSYDPDLRRDTPLALKLKDRIRREGPISVSQYMEACLHDPQFGYYRTQNAIGAAGDFVTAPEISQVFGELIGLWCAVVWQQMGSPNPMHLVELGPGRGTLMRDALTAAGKVTGLLPALEVHLIESNPILSKTQQSTIGTGLAPLRWYPSWSFLVKSHSQDRLDFLERRDTGLGNLWPPPAQAGPTILVANEFLDVLPVQQIEYADGAWRHRRIGLDACGMLSYSLGPVASAGPERRLAASADEASVFTFTFKYREIVKGLLLARAKAAPLAALFIDYGHSTQALGDTLQAVRNHKPESVFASAGEADLTAHVDFSAFAREATDAGLAVDGPTTQAEFLGRLGVVERASKLMSANPARAAEIEAGVARLIAPNGMGTRFKAIGIRSPGLPKLPGF
jgi:NADH dehydrogenase [ubiquinone] 1 alpha subcomplex assembly factor 7